MFNAFKMADMDSLIEAGKKLEISTSTIFYKGRTFDIDGNRIIINFESLLDNYSDFIKKIIVEIELSEQDMMLYRFQPRKFSFDTYQTTELWTAILRINHMVSVTEFTRKKIKVFTEDIFDVINEIIILNEDKILDNKIFAYAE